MPLILELERRTGMHLSFGDYPHQNQSTVINVRDRSYGAALIAVVNRYTAPPKHLNGLTEVQIGVICHRLSSPELMYPAPRRCFSIN